jgi:hypothetical protein
MGVEVDSVIVDLEARIGQYRTNMQEAIGLQREFRAEVEKPSMTMAWRGRPPMPAHCAGDGEGRGAGHSAGWRHAQGAHRRR